jgi:hypothetical protein
VHYPVSTNPARTKPPIFTSWRKKSPYFARSALKNAHRKKIPATLSGLSWNGAAPAAPNKISGNVSVFSAF